MSSLLDRQLERQLAPVTAPEALWGRIEAACVAQSAPKPLPWRFVAAAALAACGLAGAVVLSSEQSPRPYAIAARPPQVQTAAFNETSVPCKLCHVD